MQRQALQVIAGEKKTKRASRSSKKSPRKKPAVFLTTAKTVAGHLAMWAVRQNPYPRCPAHLDMVVGRLLFQLTKHAKTAARSNSLMKMTGMFRTDRRSLEKLVMEVLRPMREFQRWNERKNGNLEPFNLVSRYDDPTKREPDNEFIDLSALVRNVATSVAIEEGAATTTAHRRK
jgi:hypothetical protein